MRFDRLRAKGFGPFKETIDIDFSSLPGGIVAVVGQNGAGKSVMLELLAGAMFRECPTRGSLASLATARDAFVEVHVVYGAALVLRQSVDGQSGKGESLVLDATGRPMLPDLKVGAFDKWAARNLPSREVLFASTFAAQGAGGFLEMRAGDRKAVILRVLGIERLERLAETSRERLRVARGALQTVMARATDERARSTSTADLEAALETERASLDAAEARVRLSRERLDAGEALARDFEAGAERRRTALSRIRQLDARAAEARTRVSALWARINNNRTAVARSKEIRAADTRAEEIKLRDLEIGSELRMVELERQAGAKRKSDAELLLRQSTSDVEKARKDVGRAKEAATTAASMRELPTLLDEANVAMHVAEAELCALERNEECLRLAIADGWTDRVDALREGVAGIAAGCTEPASEVAEAILRDDDDAARRQQEAPTEFNAAREKVRAARATVTASRASIETLERRLSELKAHQRLASTLATCEAELQRLEDQSATCDASVLSAARQIDSLAERRRTLELERMRLAEERAEIIGVASLAPTLAAAETLLAELEPTVVEAELLVSKLAAEREDIEVPEELPPAPSLASLRADLDESTRAVRSHAEGIAVMQAKLIEAEASEARFLVLSDDARRLEADAADWSRLSEDLGRDGLQALEIDAAGPELTALVNDLLHASFGTRWTVSIEASRMSSDGKKVLEGLEVRVIDSERGRDALAESLSGGERVLVGEALSLALTMLACRRSDLEGPTLIRDESGAALDSQAAAAYLAMLRRAADLVGASRVLLVTHCRSLAEMADARIEVHDGTVTVAA